MGGSSSSKPDAYGLVQNIYCFDSVQKLIDSYESVEIDQTMFTKSLFSKFDQNPHPTIGRITVSNTFIIRQLFMVLANRNKDAKLKTSKLKDQIGKIYKNPQKAIQYSFRLIDLDDDKKITKAEFLSYFDNVFTTLLQVEQKKIKHFLEDQLFLSNFLNWIKTNKKVFAENVLKMFQEYGKSSNQFWLMGDFKRWIIDKRFWSLDIQIGALKIRTPVNLLCLFAIEI